MKKTQSTVGKRVVAVMVAAVLVLTATVGTVAAETKPSDSDASEVLTSRSFKLYNDPERDLKLTARGMKITVSGNLYTLWSYHSTGTTGITDKPFAYLGLRIETRVDWEFHQANKKLYWYFPTNGIKITDTSHPQYHPKYEEKDGKNTSHMFAFGNIPEGEYRLVLEAVQNDFSMFSFAHNISVSGSGIKFVFDENYAIHKARLDSYEPPTGERYLTERSDTVKAKAAEITKGITDSYEKAKAIHLWIANNITYVGVNNSDLTAEYTLKHKKGACTEFAILTAALLNAVDIPARVIGSDILSHAWAEAFADDRWITMDATLDSGAKKNHLVLKDPNGVKPVRILPEKSIPATVSLGDFDRTIEMKYGYNVAIDASTY